MCPAEECRLRFALTIYCKDSAGQQLTPKAVDEIIRTRPGDSTPLFETEVLLEQRVFNSTYAQYYHDVKEGVHAKECEEFAHKAYDAGLEQSKALFRRYALFVIVCSHSSTDMHTD